MENTNHFSTSFKRLFNLKSASRSILYAIIPASLFYMVSLFGLRARGFETMEILRDPAQQSGASSFIGFLSNIGIWLWVSAAAICFFTITMSRPILRKDHKELIILTGILSIVLAVDDFFLIHDRYIDQNICFLFYAIIAIAILIRHSKKIIEIEGFSFLVAGTLLALSILADVIQEDIPIEYTHTQIFEEGFKFIGAATWLYFNSKLASYREQQLEASS